MLDEYLNVWHVISMIVDNNGKIIATYNSMQCVCNPYYT